MNYLEAIEVAKKAMEDAVEQGGGDDIRMTKALADAMQDPRIAQAFETVGLHDLLAEQNTQH
ncbi:hypothetical protein LMG19282_04229 [Cupriavidus campinensis]|uniref:hypothetical protein n=1 Tax=Cupriavidus campinensis TaxID=151783 RepID=UPI001B27F3A8|nr:hypothetical protein [Cupriavidus campinensis]CAG2152604.1 hypothetical protein LMG19282_04229 [Cupriavidus campinensis]